MDEKTLSPEERLKQLNEERKALKEQVKDSREKRLEEAAKMRVSRDEKIEKIQEKLKKIQSVIYDYNKLGKVAKVEYDVLGIISKEVNSEYTEEDLKADQLDASERYN